MRAEGRVRVAFVLADGQERFVETETGTTLRDAAIFHDVPGIVGECGGFGACGTCHVYVAETWRARLPKPKDDEDAMLENVLERRSESRLACQIVLTPDLDEICVRMPERQF